MDDYLEQKVMYKFWRRLGKFRQSLGDWNNPYEQGYRHGIEYVLDWIEEGWLDGEEADED